MAVNHSFTSAVQVDWDWASLSVLASVSLPWTGPSPRATWAACRAPPPAQCPIGPSRSWDQVYPFALALPVTYPIKPLEPEAQLPPSGSASPVADLISPSTFEVQSTPSVSASHDISEWAFTRGGFSHGPPLRELQPLLTNMCVYWPFSLLDLGGH